MGKIKNFICTYDNSAGISEDITKKLELQFPDAYCHHESLVKLSLALKERDQAVFCEMPFCHTVEAEAMGGSIKLGDGKAGPRASEYVCTTIEEVLKLPEIDFTKGRIHEVLLACKELKKQGEMVVLEISGPFTILNTLLDAKHIFHGMRKNPEMMQRIFDKIKRELLRYVVEAEKHGVKFISYADSTGGVNILGPKISEQVVHAFTYDFLKQLDEHCESETMILLCPKTTFALLGTEKAKLVDIELETEMNYQEACLLQSEKVRFAGQMCIKNTKYRLENKIFKEVKLI